MSLKRGRDDPPANDLGNSQGSDQFESSPIEDRASKFVGLFSSVIPAKELQAHPPYKKASHRILAWRKPSKQQSLTGFKASGGPSVIYTTGSDDDGEKYAGKKLEKLLIDLDVEGAIVVARWYGGVMLGPVRFSHMEQVARDAINKWRASRGHDMSSKKQKVEPPLSLSPAEEAERKARLVTTLGNRDNSIKVLRDLLAEKKAATSSGTSTLQSDPPRSSAGTQTTTPDYSSLPLSKLQQLEKARDTTISWILKQIDDAEAKVTPGQETEGAKLRLEQSTRPAPKDGGGPQHE